MHCHRSLWEMLVAPSERLQRRTYNVTAMSFSPEEIVAAVRRHFPDLRVTYKPDSRQNIGESHTGNSVCEGEMDGCSFVIFFSLSHSNSCFYSVLSFRSFLLSSIFPHLLFPSLSISFHLHSLVFFSFPFFTFFSIFI